jgi:trigger factor
VPGFRKGKAPRAIIENIYGKDVFHEDAAYIVVDETWPKAVDDNNLEPVDRPELVNIDYSLDKDLVYTVNVTVKPEVELGEYKGVKAEKVEYPVTDEDIEKQLQSMREKNARIINKEDGTVEKGDTAVIDFEGFIDGVPFDGGKDTNHSLEIGSGSFIEGFEDQLMGKKAGEEVDVKVTFPGDYRAAELAGKDATFKVKINEVKYKELLPLDDEFAKDVSEFETLDELKADLRKKLEESNELRAKREFEDKVIKAVVENSTVDIPKVMVDREIDYMLDNLNYRLQYQGLSLEQYAQYTNTSIDKMKEDYRDAALSSVKTELVLQKVSKVENISPSDKDINQEIEKMAKQYNQELDKFKATLQEREMEIVKNEVITHKAVDFLVQNAVTAA